MSCRYARRPPSHVRLANPPRPPSTRETVFASTKCALAFTCLGCVVFFFFLGDWTRGFSLVCHTIKACGVGWLMIDHGQPPVFFCLAPSARVCRRPRDSPLVYQPFYKLPGFQASLSFGRWLPAPLYFKTDVRVVSMALIRGALPRSALTATRGSVPGIETRPGNARFCCRQVAHHK